LRRTDEAGRTPTTQDGHLFRRYKCRWKLEHLSAWLWNWRRVVVRDEPYALNYLGFVHLGCILISLKRYV
jgi:transposase